MIKNINEKRSRVLIIEQEDIKMISISALFLGAGLRVDTAKHGREAIEMINNSINQQPFDIIFMDLDIPGLDKLELNRKVLSMLPVALKIPLVLLIKPGFDDKIPYQDNIAGIIEKPLTPDNLFSAISGINTRIAMDIKEAAKGFAASLGSI